MNSGPLLSGYSAHPTLPNTRSSGSQYKATRSRSTLNWRSSACHLVITSCRVTEVDESAMNQVDADATLSHQRARVARSSRTSSSTLGRVPIMLQAVDDA